MRRWFPNFTVLCALVLMPVACSSGPSSSDAGYSDGSDGDAALGDDGNNGSDLNPTEEDLDGDGLVNVLEDRDQDGVLDDGETDPSNPDTDSDGIIDGVEDHNHNGKVDWNETDPLKDDTDGDGLSDGLEDSNHNGIVDPGESDPLKPDTDRDGLDDGLEDANHNGVVDPGETDPVNPDTDSDGLLDGVEDSNHNGVVDSGETDPNNPDMDSDGVADGDEDRDGDGKLGQCTIPCSTSSQCSEGQVCAQHAHVCYSSECSGGETDPFDPDTDGDSVTDDLEASTLVCTSQQLKPVDIYSSEEADFKLALETFYSSTSALTVAGDERGLEFYDPQHQLAGFVLSKSPGASSAARQEAEDRIAIGTLGSIESVSTRALVTFDGFDAVVTNFDLRPGQVTPVQLAGMMADVLAGTHLDSSLASSGTPSGQFHVSMESVLRPQRSVVLAIVSASGRVDDSQLLKMEDVSNSTALAGFTDGTDSQCDSFRSVGVQPVDFIWVVDNSESMSQEQSAVSAAADAMASLLQKTSLDWRVAITKSDPTQGGGLLFTPFTRDVNRFKSDMILVGTAGAPNEYSLQMGLDAMDNSLPCSASEDRYKLRCDAQVIVILLSDEDDQSIENASGGDNYAGAPDAATVAGFAESYRQRGAVLFAIAGLDPKCSTALNSSKGINAVVNAVGGGSVGSICDLDQSQNVENIVRAAFGVSSTYRLREPPISSTLKVALVLEQSASPLLVPRSRIDGFDYDGVSGSILFYGSYRPVASGLDVVASYRTFVDCQPQQEECNGRDDDCDGLTDEDFDADGDGWSVCGGDCDDHRSEDHPGAEEVCDLFDNDCDGETDEGFDGDGDGFSTCNGDCDPDDPAVFPTAFELCDDKDNDCDGETDPDCG